MKVADESRGETQKRMEKKFPSSTFRTGKTDGSSDVLSRVRGGRRHTHVFQSFKDTTEGLPGGKPSSVGRTVPEGHC